MWEKIEADGVCYTDNGGAFTPVVTLKNGEKRAQIVDSRSHYTLWFQKEDGKHHRTDLWFIEAIDALNHLAAKRKRRGRPFVDDEFKESNNKPEPIEEGIDEDLCRS